MFLTWDQVILVKDQSKRKHNDDVVFIRNGKIGIEDETKKMRNTLYRFVQQTLWPAFNPAMCTELEQAGMTRYGTIYQDANGDWCIIPDKWDENDPALSQAKRWI